MRHASRRRFLTTLTLAPFLPLLGGCVSRGIPQAGGQGESPAARALLQKSADAHGLAAWRQIRDLSVSYAGEWRGLVARLQPTLIDAGFRQGSEERLITGPEPLLAQHHRGPAGSKQVVRRAGGIRVDYNGHPNADPEVLAAAALVADGYRMFITGPFYFLDGNLHLEAGAPESIDGHPCDTLVALRRPGNGLAAEDRFLLFIDRETALLRRVRFSLDGLESTLGAIAEVDFFEYRRIDGVLWPTRFFERLRKPVPNLPVHDWRLTGLDVNRGFGAEDIDGPAFSGKAAAPARLLVAG